VALTSDSLPERCVELERWLLDSPGEISGLRGKLARRLDDEWGDPEQAEDPDGLGPVPDRMVVVASELAANALRHGLPPTLVRLLRDGDRHVLDVADHDLSAVPELADRGADAASGRGLLIATTLSLDVGWYVTDRTKHVWAVFPGPRTATD
jgi:serine/threonine-protein kinase RsbW